MPHIEVTDVELSLIRGALCNQLICLDEEIAHEGTEDFIRGECEVDVLDIRNLLNRLPRE